jgi:DNA-binding NtrC family response regulator
MIMANILIADDEDLLRRNLALIMNSAGYSTFSARSSVEAIGMFRKHTFDLLITDLVMPEKGGGELIHYIAEHWPETQIIIMTAYPNISSAIDAVKHGVFDYFTKPFKTDEMLKAVEKALESRKEVPFIWGKLHSFNITGREEEILKAMIEDGVTASGELADRFSIKTTTIKQHLENLYGKFGVQSRTALITSVIKILRK